MNDQMFKKMAEADGFIAALDQSGGSTPKALRSYGVGDDAWSTEEEMFDRIHEMRARIIKSPAFNGDRIIGAILFENTMDRSIDGMGTPAYLWDVKQVVPFLKVDKGLADEANGVQLMKPIPDLEDLVARGRAAGVFGTKMRSVVKQAGDASVKAIANQQFEFGHRILAGGLVPILEPEIDIHSPTKAEAEVQLRAALLEGLDGVGADQHVMFKLTIPDEPGFYRPLIDHPQVLRVVALSGGYSRDEANDKLAQNHGMVASFSRALLQDLRAQQTDQEFDAALDEAIASIYAASIT